MQKKRGQLTIFIIIGVIITSLIIGGIYVNSSIKEKASRTYFQSEGIKEELNKLNVILEGCLEDLSADSIYLIGNQGGYYTKPEKNPVLGENNQDSYGEFLPYYYYRGEYYIPELINIQNHMSGYIEDNFKSCLRENSNDFFKIETNPKPTVKIQPGIVNFDFSGDITLSSEKHSMKIDLEEYKESFQVNLYGIQEVAKYLTLSHNEDPTLYCLSCLITMLEEQSLYLDYYTLNENDIAVIIIDKNNDLGEEYYFSYLNKYTGEEESKKLNKLYETAPLIPEIGEEIE
jgi:hypothetical protein